MKLIIKINLMFIVTIQVIGINTAAIKVRTEFPTGVKVVFSNGDSRKNIIFNGDSPFSADGGFEGVAKVQWLSLDNHVYEASVDMPGIQAWRDVVIKKGNSIYIGKEYGHIFATGAEFGTRGGRLVR